MRPAWTLVLLTAAACGGARASTADQTTAPDPTVEATSLLGEPLIAPELAPDVRANHETKLAEAQAAYDAAPDDADAIIWLGRRQAYLGRYRAAIATFTEGIRKHPDDARMYRHRGHRYITTRQLDRAVADLERAADLRRDLTDEIEPDGLPNRHNIPTSTLHTNIYYHLGLARFLRAEYDRAIDAYRACLAASKNDDMTFATAHWLYMALRRAGHHAEAEELVTSLPADPTILENTAYHQLVRLYRHEVDPDDLATDTDLDRATIGFGLSNWYRLTDRDADALATARGVVAGPTWPAFGYTAAEADLAATPR